MKSQKRVLVRCTIRDGMFSDEAVVAIKNKSGRLLYFTVPSADVDRARSLLWAHLVEDNVVQLPTNYRDTVAVAPDALEFAS